MGAQRKIGLFVLFISTLFVGVARATDISWNNSLGGSWSDSSNWLPNAVPGTSDNAIISLAGSYTLTAENNLSVGSVSLTATAPIFWIRGSNAGGQSNFTSNNGFTNNGTLRIESIDQGWNNSCTITSGVLSNAGTIQINTGTGGTRTITGNVTNTGSINVDSTATLNLNATGATFNQNGGSINGTGLFLMDNGSFNYNAGTTTGNVYLRNSQLNVAGAVSTPSTVIATGGSPTLVNNASSNVTVWAQGCDIGGHTTLNLPNGSANSGTIRMESINQGWNTNLNITGSFTNNASGIIQVNPGTGGTRYINGNLTNAGTIIVDPSALLIFFNGYTAAGGTISGPGYLLNAILSETASPGAPTTILTTGGGATLTSNNLSNTTLWVQGSDLGGHTTLTAATSFSNNGTLRMESINQAWNSNVTLTSGVLSNAATIQVNAGTGGTRILTGNVTNTGTINVGTGTTLNINATSATFNQNAGSINGTGQFLMDSGSFNFNGGSTTGSVYLRNSQLNVAGAVSTPSTVIETGGSPTLLNNSSSNATVWVQGCDLGGHTTLNLPNGSSNSGTIRMESINAGYNCDLNITGNFTNNTSGVIQANPGTGGTRNIYGHITNAGTINVSAGVQTIIPNSYTAAGGTINGPGYLVNATLNETASPASPTSILTTGPSLTLTSDNLANTTIWVQGDDIGSHTTMTSANGFTNAGTIRLESVSTGYNCNLTLNSGTLNNTGTIQANVGTGGGRVITGSITNTGAINVGTGITLSVNNTGDTFNQNAGNISAAGLFLLDNGAFNFNGGSTSGNGGVVLRNSQLNVAAGVTTPSTVITTGGSPTIINAASPNVTVWVQGSDLGSHTTLTSASGFTNAGTLRMESVNTGYSSNVNITSGVLNNAGTIQVNPGTGGGRTITGNVTNGGTINLASGAGLYINGNLTNNSGSTLSGGIYSLAGPFAYNGATFSTLDANVTLDGLTSGITDQNSVNAFPNLASITSAGTLSLKNARNISTGAATFSNAGQLSLASNSTFAATGSFAQTSTGTLSVQIGGLTPGTGFSQVTAGTNAALDGALVARLTGGFAPAVNDSFEIVVGASRSGQFANLNGLEACGSRAFQIVYGPTDAKLVTIASTFPLGDLNHDNVVDSADMAIFVNVILGYDADYLHQVRSDLNCDGLVNGLDIQPFIHALLGT